MKAIPLLAAAWCAVLALADFNCIWIYQLSRWALCAAAVHGALSIQGRWRWVLWVLAVFYNPIAPVHFGKAAWLVVNWISAAGFVLSVGELRRVVAGVSERTWAAFLRIPREGDNVFHFIWSRLLLVVVIAAGAFVGYQVWWESTPEGQAYWREENAKRDAARERIKADRANPLIQNEPESRQAKKYPRALNGGGLDWSGVDKAKRNP